MRFKDVFSIIGPVMIGPSSSHTAGAVRLGRVARGLLGTVPEKADITLYGSFSETYQGHGTDMAIVGGLLDFDTDDPRIPQSYGLAAQTGLVVAFHRGIGAVHPNTALLELSAGSRRVVVRGASIGGGNIEIDSVNGFDVKFAGMYPTLVLLHRDRPGVIAAVSGLLSGANVNISYMAVDRKARSGEAMTVIETDEPPDDRIIARLAAIPDILEASRIYLAEGGARCDFNH